MANVQQITRDYLLRARTEGVAATTAATQQLSAATDALATKTETVTKSQTSAAAALDRVQRSLDLNYRSMKQFDNAQRDLDRAQQQGLITTARHAELMVLANARYQEATNGQKALSVVTQDLNGRISAAAGATGTFGGALSALGPWGIAAAATIGGVVLALNAMSSASHALAEKSQELRRFAEITGLTTAQVQALRSEASKFGVTSEEAEHAVQQFTARFNDLRLGQGALLTQIRRVNPALADQMQATTNAGDALTLFGQALLKVDDVFQRNALIKAATGKGGLANAAFLTGLDVSKVTQSFVDAGKALDDGLIKRLAQLEIDIHKTSAQAQQQISSIFAEPVLQAELSFYKTFLDIVKEAKGFTISSDLKFYLESLKAIAAAPLKGIGAITASAGQSTADAYFSLRGNGQQQFSQYDPNKGITRGVPPTAPRDSTFDNFNFATGAPGKGAAEASLTLEAQAEKIKKINEVLGAATTFQQHYNFALAELAVKAKDAGVSQESLTYQLAKGALDLDLAMKRTSALNGVLGIAATVQDQYGARLQQIAKAQMEGAGASDAQLANAKRLAMAQADGTFQLQAQINATKVQTATIGMSVAQAEVYTLVQTKINENLNAGRPALDGVTAAYRKLAQASGEAKQAEQLISAQYQANIDLETVFMSALEKRIALMKKSLGDSAQTQQVADTLRMTDALKSAQSAAESFGTSFASSMLSGKSLTESLTSSLNSLATTAANAGIKNLLEGNFAMAAIDAVVTIGAKLGAGAFDDSQAKELKKAQEAWANMNGQLKQFEQTAANFDLSGPAGQILQFKSTLDTLWVAAMKAGDAAGATRAWQAFQGNVVNTVVSFNQLGDVTDATVKQIQQITMQGKSLVEALAQVGRSDLAGGVRDSIAKQIANVQKAAADSLQQGINSAQGKTYVNDLTALFAQVQQFRSQQAINGLPTSLINDYFVAQAQKIIDSSNLVGAQFNDLLTIFPNLTGKVKESNSALQAQAAAQQQLQASLTAAARGIVDYLNSTNLGASSTLSPQQRLTASQATYNATLALAQGNNVDALNRITADAENYRKALASFFGSSSGYQSGWATIQQQLLGLPAVATSSDPVVAAVRDVVTAVQQTTAAAQGTTGAVGTNTSATITSAGDTTTAVQNANALLSAMNGLLSTSNGILSAIQSLQNTASAQLTLLNNNLTLSGAAISASALHAAVGVAPPASVITSNNNLLTALNKIVINTYATAFNTEALNSANSFSYAGGTFAQGGTLGAGQFGIMGEHHPQGPFIIRAGSQPVPITPALPSFAANDNSGMVAAIARLEARVAALQQELALNTAVTHQGNEINAQGHAANVGATTQQTRTVRDQAGLDRAHARAA